MDLLYNTKLLIVFIINFIDLTIPEVYNGEIIYTDYNEGV